MRTTRATRRRTPTAGAPRAGLRLELLETREVPAVLIQIDYSYDTGFFTNNAQARAAIERVASDLGNSLTANPAAIDPSGTNTWSETFYNPSTGAQVSVANPSVGANTLKVYVGGRALGGGEAGSGGPGGYSLSGSAAWISTVQTRGHSGYSTWGGSVSFDRSADWFFGLTTAGLTANKIDFTTAATHELGHVLGVGTSSQWNANLSGSTFVGSNARAVYGGAVPLSPDRAHWADGVTVGGAATVLDPVLPRGTRIMWSALDAAGLRDLGWGATTITSPPPAVSPPPATSPPPPATSPPPAPAPQPTPIPTYTPPSTAGNPQPVAFTGGNDGTLFVYRGSGAGLYATGQRFTPFAGYRGELRVASGDFNGDGVTDFAVATGAGSVSMVAIINGRDGSFLVSPTVLWAGYTGGFYLAAGDIDGDGRAELVVAAGADAPPVVATFRVGGGGLQLQMSFIAFDAAWWRGGIRVAAGDLNRDGYADVVVTTGSGLGAVAIYNGADLRNGTAVLMSPIFVPAPGFAVGLNAAVGDLDGDGYGDLALTFERGGPSVVAVWSGATLTANPTVPVNQLPAVGVLFPLPGDAGGGRLAVRDLDGDGRAELVFASGSPQGRYARVFTFDQVSAGAGGSAYAAPLGAAPAINGIYVG